MCIHIVNAILTGPLPDASNSFIVAVTYLRNIYQVDITSGATGQLLPFGTASIPVALAYDSTAKLVYWTDVVAHTINRYSLLTNSSTVIYRDPASTGNNYASVKSVWTSVLYLYLVHFWQFCKKKTASVLLSSFNCHWWTSSRKTVKSLLKV